MKYKRIKYLKTKTFIFFVLLIYKILYHCQLTDSKMESSSAFVYEVYSTNKQKVIITYNKSSTKKTA